MRHIYEEKIVLMQFYKTLQFSKFMTIDEERKKEIDEIIQKYQYFKQQASSFKMLMFFIAYKLTMSYKYMGIRNGDEKAYFFIQMIDPDLLFLEAYESANTQDELKAFCFQNFGIYDPIMIKLEKEFNKKFLSLSDADLWSRERIKRSEIKKKDK